MTCFVKSQGCIDFKVAGYCSVREARASIKLRLKLRKALIKYGCLELLMESLLLFKLKRGERVIDSRQNSSSSLLRDLIGTAMGTLYK